MKISNELLKRYSVGNCNPQEKLAVEAWINSLQDDGLLSEKEFGNSIDSIRKKLFKTLFHQKGETPIIRFYKNTMRFAAAACIIFAAFFGGRVSANRDTPVHRNGIKFNENLYIYNGKKSYGNIPGEFFKIQLDGRIRLYNASKKTQRLIVGDSTFTLHPNRNYYLTGSTESAELTAESEEFIGKYSEDTIPAVFSILRLNN